MKHTIKWLGEEEGSITFYEDEKEVLEFRFFVISEEEAELKLVKLQNIEAIQQKEEIPKELVQTVTNGIREAFWLLWEEGLEETVLVEQKGTNVWKLLQHMDVVETSYSEYMMQRFVSMREFGSKDTNSLYLWEEEEGLVCENSEKSFFCRLLPYQDASEHTKGYYLYEVEVAEEKRNQGIATDCLNALFAKLTEKNAVMLYLQVGSYNQPALHLYEKLGFKVQEELCYYAAAEE